EGDRRSPSRCQILRRPSGLPEDGCGRPRDVWLPPGSWLLRSCWNIPHRSIAVSLAERIPGRSHSLPRAEAGMRPVLISEVPVRRGGVDAVLATRHAGTRRLRLDYELVGPEDAPVVFVVGGISADRHVAANPLESEPGWAQGLLDPGRTLDPSRLRVLACDH